MAEFEPGEGEPGLGGCVTEALRQAGYDEVEFPEWVKFEDMPRLCEELGMKYHGEGEAEIPANKRMIGIYKTRPGKAHAELVDDIGKLVEEGRDFIGIIELPND
jgi:hypothetical protein